MELIRSVICNLKGGENASISVQNLAQNADAFGFTMTSRQLCRDRHWQHPDP